LQHRRLVWAQHIVAAPFHQRAPAPPVRCVDRVWSSVIGAHVVGFHNDGVGSNERCDVQIAQHRFDMLIALARKRGIVAVPRDADDADRMHQIAQHVGWSSTSHHQATAARAQAGVEVAQRRDHERHPRHAPVRGAPRMASSRMNNGMTRPPLRAAAPESAGLSRRRRSRRNQ
jgi:hypothetical protein